MDKFKVFSWPWCLGRMPKSPCLLLCGRSFILLARSQFGGCATIDFLHLVRWFLVSTVVVCIVILSTVICFSSDIVYETLLCDTY